MASTPHGGDFLEHGVPGPVLRALEHWLDRALAECRAELGDDWPRLWGAGPVLRFWCGEALAGQVMAGVMAPSHDRVGRRFPLLLLAEDLPPPSVDPDQSWYDRAEAHLRAQIAAAAFESAPALLDGLAAPERSAPVPEPGACGFLGDAAGDGCGGSAGRHRADRSSPLGGPPQLLVDGACGGGGLEPGSRRRRFTRRSRFGVVFARGWRQWLGKGRDLGLS
jgi:type VI secretion system ImpM family protein